MTAVTSSTNADRRKELLALAEALRPELHRYCARLMGSVIDGEDVVQDTLVKALVALQDMEDTPPFRQWLFRIAHNRGIDLLRGRAIRSAAAIEPGPVFSQDDSMAQPDHPESHDPAELLMRQETIDTAVTRFAKLPVVQRSVVILKDVLDESLLEISALLDLSVDSVKAHLSRGRALLRELNAPSVPTASAPPPSPAVARYVALFNQRNWDGLRALLADDVKLIQSSHAPRVGSVQVGSFFTTYARFDGLSLAPAWLEGREVIAVFENRAAPTPSYMMWLEWRDGQITFIRDYRYVRYAMTDAELVLAPETEDAN
jgi:RNA polymerase sigma-70 factor (ECF subfamily)